MTDPLGHTTTNTYDAHGNLLTQGANLAESYTYDPVGNRLSSLIASYTVNSSNEMTAVNGAMYTYDANGNTLVKTDSTGTTSYTWDYENRLVSVTLPGSGGAVSFKYDPFGRRIYKSSSSGTSVFAYDGDNLVEETNSSGAVVARYAQGAGIDEPLAQLRSATTSFYSADGLGSITSLSNAAASITDTYTFDSFGKLAASTGTTVNPFRYTARESDAETGLYYYRARYYDPAAGRFLNEDPIGFNGGTNLYPYVANNPVTGTDAFGFDSDSDYCRRLREKIENIRQRIQKRRGELDEDPLGLPESCPGDWRNPGLSRRGHRRLINMDKALLAAREAEYAIFCKDLPKPPIPVPSPQRSPQTSTNNTAAAVAVVVIIIILAPVLIFM